MSIDARTATTVRNTDVVTRLRLEGADAMRKHLSLGMHALCTEAADEITQLRAEVVTARNTALINLKVARDRRLALEEIAALDDSRCDECCVIANRALGK